MTFYKENFSHDEIQESVNKSFKLSVLSIFIISLQSNYLLLPLNISKKILTDTINMYGESLNEFFLVEMDFQLIIIKYRILKLNI